MRAKRIMLFLLLSITLSVGHQTAIAEESVGFSIKAQLSNSQISPDVSYFDLRVEPGRDEFLEISVYNHKPEPLTVEVHVFNASTNRNGLIVYEPVEPADSLVTPLTDWISLKEDRLTVEANGTGTIRLDVTSIEPFDGIKLGGVYVEKVNEDEDNQGVMLSNQYAYVTAIQLSENDEPVMSEVEFISVGPELINYRTAVTAQIENVQPEILADLSIEAQLYEVDSNELVTEQTYENWRMAPNSTADIGISLNNRPIQAGDYRLEMTVFNANHVWEFEELFSIEEADEAINEQAVDTDDEHNGEERVQSLGIYYGAGAVVWAGSTAGLLVYIRKLKKKH
ncbi:DUF916 and DUF3324 domain-containing protein [Alkalibacterium sp. AK22]|uniref:DUF916 and DUF3324 domain-containing protein n=1 Tax=Alkalibacterium sp. AK22 TaxID=1229520 RepID=UPI00055509A7|nr:DUF916 and DUF3324 domain-containing protein [Alkalibacterium sp. AK22]